MSDPRNVDDKGETLHGEGVEKGFETETRKVRVASGEELRRKGCGGVVQSQLEVDNSTGNRGVLTPRISGS